MNKNVFEQISSRYGISPEALEDAWDKTSGAGSHEDHVKKFKTYLEKLTGQAHYNYNMPELDSDLAEAAACEFLKRDFQKIEEAIDAIMTEKYGEQLSLMEEALDEQE